MKSSQYYLFYALLIITSIQSREVIVKVGDEISLCCNLDFKNDALVIFGPGTRIRTLFKNSMHPGDDLTNFNASHPGFYVKQQSDTLCINKQNAVIKDDKFFVKCSVLKDGFGATLAEEKITLMIYDLKFVTQIPQTMTVKVGESKSIFCDVSGHPDLKVFWRIEKVGKISSEKSPATLDLKNITSQMNGNVYICEASVNIAVDKFEATKTQNVTLNVLFKPELDIQTSVIHTDLDIQETFYITVMGNPQPKLNCPLLQIKMDRLMTVTNPSPSKFLYVMEISKVTPEIIGKYLCNVSNSEGTISKEIILSLKPENLQITSSNYTPYSDGYILTWTMNSKASVTNFTVEIETYESFNTSTITKEIENNEKKYEKSFGQEDNWKKSFSYPITNITSDKEHKISLQVCNKHECIKLKNAVSVRTPKVGDNNKYDPRNMLTDLDNPNSNTIYLRPSLLFVITQAMVMLLLPLALLQVY